jgi:hypothetical protein
MSRRNLHRQLQMQEARLEELQNGVRNISTSDAVTTAVARILAKAPELQEFVLGSCRFTTYALKGSVMREVMLRRGRERSDVKLYLIVVSDQLPTKRERVLEWHLARQIASACLRVFNSGKSRRKLRSEADELATSWGFTPVE